MGTTVELANVQVRFSVRRVRIRSTWLRIASAGRFGIAFPVGQTVRIPTPSTSVLYAEEMQELLVREQTNCQS